MSTAEILIGGAIYVFVCWFVAQLCSVIADEMGGPDDDEVGARDE
jgi:hypothetical protein